MQRHKNRGGCAVDVTGRRLAPEDGGKGDPGLPRRQNTAALHLQVVPEWKDLRLGNFLKHSQETSCDFFYFYKHVTETWIRPNLKFN